MLYPMLLKPSLHLKVWGGRKLADIVQKDLPTDEPYGESWELHDTATITNGEYAGQTLGELLQQLGTELVGEGNNPADGFPLLAKFLDANTWLSIQVHPNDEQAAELEGEPRGKTEAWIFIHTEPGAQLVIGMKPGTTREAMSNAIRDGKLQEHLAYAEVQKGDAILLNANAVHALGPGILIYEIQQSSDTTYRLYDWNRKDRDGNLRELHIEKGVKVSNLDYLPDITHPWDESQPEVTLVECPYFKTNQHNLHGDTITLDTHGKFQSLTCLAGTLIVSANDVDVTVTTGQTALIPAGIPTYTIEGTGSLLRSWQPQ